MMFFAAILVVVSCSYNSYNQSSKYPHQGDDPNNDSLQELIISQEAQIDSLNSMISFLSHQIESLMEELESVHSKVLINDTFIIPNKYSFGGVEIDLTNDRVRSKLQTIYETEVKTAQVYIPRSGIYFALMDSIFAIHGVHPDVKYLAVAESYLNYMAYSPAKAAGIWQFIPGTAKLYNLKIDSYVDERRDFFKSTNAACRYLLQAHRELNRLGIDDWLVTFASYNAGVGNISRVIKEQNGKDFSSLIMRHDETHNYVWRAVALKMIFEYENVIFERPFTRSAPLLETAKLVNLEVNGYYDLADWAVAQGTNANTVWELNPWIDISRTRQGRYARVNNLIIPPGKFEILIPSEAMPDFTKIAEIEKKFLVKNNSPFLTGDSTRHIVQKGETLSHIARRYNLKVDDIKRWNNLKNDTIIAGKTLYLQSNQTTTVASSQTKQDKKYQVVSGDTLSGISQKLGVSTSHLISTNNLKSDMIRPGQILEY